MSESSSDMVADIGNTRLKWGRIEGGRVVEAISLPPDDFAAWSDQRELWSPHLPRPCRWTVAGVQPAWRETLIGWIESSGEPVRRIESTKQIAIEISVDFPNRVGHDRLFNAVAAKAEFPDRPMVIVDAGTAITVDYIDATGVFQGGAIMPGLGLMSRALHNYTALLPLVELPDHPDRITLPGKNTAHAIQTGIYWQAVGGVALMCDKLRRQASRETVVIVTGGNGLKLDAGLEFDTLVRPFLTLEGIRMTAEEQP